jgi:general secretion pathway protein J
VQPKTTRIVLASTQRGFTLIELLVALVVMAVMAGLSLKGLDVMLRSRELTQTRVDAVAELENAVRQWDADLNAVNPVSLPLSQVQGSGGVPGSNGALTSVLGLEWDGRVLKIIRRSSTPRSDGLDSGLNVVGWCMRDNKWMRWQSPDITRTSDLLSAWAEVSLWAQNPGADSKRYETALIDSTGWQIYYYRDNAWSNALSSSGVSASSASLGVGALNSQNVSSTNPIAVPGTGSAPTNAGTSAVAASLPDAIRLEINLPNFVGGKLVKDWVKPSFSVNRS